MPSLLLIVFVLSVVIHLINTVGAQSINDLLWTLHTRLPTPQSRAAAENLKLRNEVVRLHREMTATSAQDDFAKWAKLRRAHDKAKDKYEQQSRSQAAFKSTFDRGVSILRWVSTQGLKFALQFWFAKEATFWLPKGWVPYYVEWILSFPRAPLGSVSINIWGICCNSIISMVSEAVVAVWALETGKVKVGVNKGEKIKMQGIKGSDTPAGGQKKEL